MTIFRANTDLANQLVIPTRIWGGTSQTAFVSNDPIQVANGVTVSGDDVVLVTPQLGFSTGIPGSSTTFLGPTRGGDEVFTGTLDLSNSTIDLHNPRITITNVTRSATSTAVTFETSDNITSLAAAFTAGSGIRRVDFVSGGTVQFSINSTAAITVAGSGNTVTYTTVGNTETGTLTLPQFADRTITYSTGPAPVPGGTIFGATATALGGNNGTSFVWDNVRVLYSGRVYNFIGNFAPRTAGFPLYNWNDVRVEGQVDSRTASSFLSFFSGAVSNNSTFNNVSFWNRETVASGDARGGTWQTTSNGIYNNTTVGPFGNQLNGRVQSRMIIRFSNQGRPGDFAEADARGLTNHAGVATNFDMRSLGQVSAATLPDLTGVSPIPSPSELDWFIDIDTGGHMYFINWLPGRPASDAIDNFTFSSLFNTNPTDPDGNSLAATRGGRAHVCVGINQQFNANGVTDVNHIVTFSDAQLNRSPTSATDSNNVRGVFFQPGAWDITLAGGLRSYVSNRVNANPGPIVFELQDADFTNRGSVTGNNPVQATHFYPIRTLTSPTFRKYSWRQQQDNNTWGREITVSVPADNASDADIATAREGGYDIYNGATWETSTNIADPVDPYVTLLGDRFNTPALARTQLTGVGSVDQGTRIPVAIKERCYDALSSDATTVDANNTQFALPYAFNNLTFNSGVRTILNGAATGASIVTNAAGDVITVTLPVGQNGIAPDSLITGLNCAGTNTLEITNSALSSTFAANQAFTYEANVIDFDNVARLGNFTARALTESFANIPATIPANMTLNGRISFGTGGQGRRSSLTTLTFDRATDVSGITLENFGTGNVTIVGKAADDFLGINRPGTGTFTFQGVQPVTFPRAGRYFIGRTRGSTYTPISTQIERTTANQVVELSGADFESTDMVHVYYKPDDGITTNNEERYDLTRTDFTFSGTAMTIAPTLIAPQLIEGLTGVFTPVTDTITSYASSTGVANFGIDVEVDIGGNLDLPETKRLFIWIQNTNDYLQVIRQQGHAANTINFTSRAVSVDQNVISLSRPTGVAQRRVTGIQSPTLGNSIEAASDTSQQDSFIIALTGTNVDFINTPVQAGITVPEVIAGVQASPIFTDIERDVTAMRTNRLLGIRPQGINSGGDFTV